MISYAITACNEHEELKRLLDQLESVYKFGHELVIQLDNPTIEVLDVAKQFTKLYLDGIDRKLVLFNLDDDFASFKNNLKSHCTKKYIFQIDADELLGSYLLNQLVELIEANPEVDVFAIPRINIVNGLTKEYVIEQRWSIQSPRFPLCVKHDQPAINYPDYQQRLFKNIPEIKWENKVHERLVGYKNMSTLQDWTLAPHELQELCLIHIKDIGRQKKQNEFYNTLMK